MAQKLRLGVVYDFRNPPESGMRTQDLYAAVMDQVVLLDSLGLDLAWFTEHHFVEDGYLPSWIPVAAAMAARTKQMRFSCDVCLLPFNHPIRLAEDLAVLDNLSGGRIEIGVGMGYAPHEFRGFGIPQSRRLSLRSKAQPAPWPSASLPLPPHGSSFPSIATALTATSLCAPLARGCRRHRSRSFR